MLESLIFSLNSTMPLFFLIFLVLAVRVFFLPGAAGP